MKPLHEELKELREEQHLSLKDIALKTKIRRDFLRRLEAGDYDVAPMPFVRAFLREYAEVLGVDATLAMAKLDKKIDTILVPKPSDEPEEATAKAPVADTRKKPSVKKTPKDTDADAPSEAPAEPEDVDPEEIQASLFVESEDVDTETDVTDDDDSAGETAVCEDEEEEADEEDAVLDEPETSDSDDVDTEEAVCDDKLADDEPATVSTVDIEESNTTVEIELQENGDVTEKVRRPLVIEEDNPLSNIVFAVIVIAILVVAGIMVFLRRGDLF